MTRPPLPFIPEGPRDPLAMIEMRELVMRKRSAFQDIAIVETMDHGRALFLDGSIQSAAFDEHIYHEFLVHPAMLMHGNVQRVLVGGVGEGASLRELFRHTSVQSVLAVDIDAELIEVAREYLPTWHAGAFDDPRVCLKIEDIKDSLDVLEPESIDLAILDLTDPVDDHEISLLDDDFFVRLATILGPLGLLVMQFGELDPEVADVTAASEARLRAAFPWVQLGSVPIESFYRTWGFAFASQTEREFSPEDLEARVKDAGLSQLTAYSAEAHRRFAMDSDGAGL